MSTKAKGKKFRVATAGATIDGRTIKPEWLDQAAKNYDPANVYGARINVDHYLGWGAKNEAFGAFGDVSALSVETNAKTGKKELWAELLPNDRAIQLNKAGQKVFTSIEIIPSFADTGEAYLVGLALTDSPASLGTSRIEFSAQPEDAMVTAAAFSDAGRFGKAEVFAAATPIELDFGAEDDDTRTQSTNTWADGLRKFVADKFAAIGKSHDKAVAAFQAQVETIVTELATQVTDRSKLDAEHIEQLSADLAAEITAGKARDDEIKLLKSILAADTSQHNHRPQSAGGNADRPQYEPAPY